LEKYLQEIAEVPLLSADEEIELAKRIKKGDQEALEKLTKANLRFVVSVAKQYQNQGLTLGDLINEGNLGLIKAATRFDETRGFKFISYAVWWIRQSILQALAEQSRVVRLPLNRVGALNRIGKALSELEQEFEREMRFRQISSISIEKDMAIVAIVGERMKHTSGVAGQLFRSLGSIGINLFAIAQGASELNISFVIRDEDLRKALNIIHEAFFLINYQILIIKQNLRREEGRSVRRWA
jgi:RNA polymerase primary sigma factor